MYVLGFLYQFFFFNESATTEIYTYCHTLSLHDALPISRAAVAAFALRALAFGGCGACGRFGAAEQALEPRSEEHTSELQSLMRISYAVFCLKKKKNK